MAGQSWRIAVKGSLQVYRRKRGDTKVGTIEQKYGLDFGVRSDMRLDTLLVRTGAASLSALLREAGADWKCAEAAACARRTMRHVGGPGQPDCADGSRVVEVKEQKRPVSRAQVRQLASKPWAQDADVEMVSRSGFSEGAVEEGAKRGIRLRRR